MTFDLVGLQTMTGGVLEPVRCDIPADEALTVLAQEQVKALRAEYGPGVVLFLRPSGDGPAAQAAQRARETELLGRSEGNRVRVTCGPYAGKTGEIVSASTEASSWVRFDGTRAGEEVVFPHDDLAPLPTTAGLEQLIAAAKAAGAEGIWLLRGVLAARPAWTPDDPNDTQRGSWPQLRLGPSHELIVLIRFEAGDGGESGVEFRQ